VSLLYIHGGKAGLTPTPSRLLPRPVSLLYTHGGMAGWDRALFRRGVKALLLAAGNSGRPGAVIVTDAQVARPPCLRKSFCRQKSLCFLCLLPVRLCFSSLSTALHSPQDAPPGIAADLIALVSTGSIDGLWAPPPRTKWTRRVPHPVLIRHAASLAPY
jgi:hypothetical protein